MFRILTYIRMPVNRYFTISCRLEPVTVVLVVVEPVLAGSFVVVLVVLVVGVRILPSLFAALLGGFRMIQALPSHRDKCIDLLALVYLELALLKFRCHRTSVQATDGHMKSSRRLYRVDAYAWHYPSRLP